jgi:hypothetical protein
MVIFENVKGSKIPLVANMHASFERLRLGLGMEKGGVKKCRGESAIANLEDLLRNHMEGIASIDMHFLFWPSLAAAAVVCGDPKPNGRMVGAPNYRSIAVGQRTEISHPRQ